MTDFNNGLEASSDSDDEDKLHIVEEDSLQEPEVAGADGTTPRDSHDAATTVLPFNGSWNGGEMMPWKHEDYVFITKKKKKMSLNERLSVCRFSLQFILHVVSRPNSHFLLQTGLVRLLLIISVKKLKFAERICSL